MFSYLFYIVTLHCSLFKMKEIFTDHTTSKFLKAVFHKFLEYFLSFLKKWNQVIRKDLREWKANKELLHDKNVHTMMLGHHS